MGDHRPIRARDPTAVAGLLICAAVALFDAAIARSTLVSPLLALGPLVASLRSGPVTTGLLAALAVALSLALATVDETVGSIDHSVALALVVAVGLLATVAAAVRERSARLTAELTVAERRLDAILANLGEAVTVRAPDGSIVFANQAAADLAGLASPLELMAATTEQLTARFDHRDEEGVPIDPARAASARALAGEQPEPMVVHRIERATGREDWLLHKATPVRDAAGRVTLAVSVLEDITATRRAERHQRFLAGAGKLVSSSLDVGATLDKSAWALVPDVADWAVVEVPDADGRLHQAAVAHEDAGARELLAGLGGDGPRARVLRDGRPLLLAGDAAAALASEAEALGTRSLAVVPVRAGDAILGTITLATTRESGRVLGEDELGMATELGVRAGIAVANARVHADRSHVATTLQRSLLPPRLPEIAGLEVAARFRAAGETTEVGGDFYDLFEARGAWLAVMGDVTGKGPEAAALTSIARYTLRTAALYEPSPDAVLERLNGVLATDPERRRLCTVAVVRVHGAEAAAADGPLRVATACGGHPPPLLVRPGEPARAAGAPGTLLGGFPAGQWPVTEAQLRGGDSLVLYTDGVTDTRGASERFGTERLADVVAGAAAAGCDADTIAARVDEALLGFQAGSQRDDVALLVLQRR